MKQHLHERRGITFQEYGALLATRTLLDRGDLEFKPSCTFPDHDEHVFNMSTKGDKNGCGTVGCIGGTMALLMGVGPRSYVQSENDVEKGHVFTPTTDQFDRQQRGACSYTLTNLFYPPQENVVSFGSWNWITPKIAVQAIDNWLRTGKPGWKALKKKFTPKAKPTAKKAR